MTERNIDPNAWRDAYLETLASAKKVQEEGLKFIERFARFQYALAGDCLEAGIAQAALGSNAPAELLEKQNELSTRLTEKLQARAQEFATLASQVQGSVANFATDAAHRATSAARKVA